MSLDSNTAEVINTSQALASRGCLSESCLTNKKNIVAETLLNISNDDEYDFEAAAARFTVVSKPQTLLHYFSSKSNPSVQFHKNVSATQIFDPKESVSNTVTVQKTTKKTKRKRVTDCDEDHITLISIGIQTDFNFPIDLKQGVEVSTQTILKNTNIIKNYLQDDQGNPTVQIRHHIRPIYDQGRQALVDEAKGRIRARRFVEMADEESFPDWALGLDQLPRYLGTIPSSVMEIKRKYAKELLLALADSLVEESHRNGELAISCLTTLKTAYKDDLEMQGEILDLMVYSLRLAIDSTEETMNTQMERLSRFPNTDEVIAQKCFQQEKSYFRVSQGTRPPPQNPRGMGQRPPRRGRGNYNSFKRPRATDNAAKGSYQPRSPLVKKGRGGSGRRSNPPSRQASRERMPSRERAQRDSSRERRGDGNKASIDLMNSFKKFMRNAQRK